MESLISCTNVSLHISAHPVLSNISFTLVDEDLVIFGPNGAGKTLLLMILSGNLTPTSGTVEIEGSSLYAKDSYHLKKHIGFISPKLFEDYDFHTSVTEIVMSGVFGSIGIAHDPSKNNNTVVRAYINRIIKEKYSLDIAMGVLQQLHIEHLQTASFGTLSYGEKVRVLIARALINKPRLFILDEPTTGLDLRMRAEFFKIVKELSSSAKIIYVTHFIEEILPQFTKILLLKKGEIFRYGDKRAVLTDNSISELLEIPIQIHQKNNRYFAEFS